MLFDPSQHLSQINLNSLPQDDSDYLADCDTLGPGMRVCAVEDVPGADQTAIQERSACTSGIVVRNGPEIRMTVSNKAFDNYDSVSHPLNDRARQFGITEERYQDLNVALVRLAPEV